MQHIVRYHIKSQKATEFRQWLVDNAAAIAENEAEGWTYLGTWFTVRGYGKYQCESRWELDDYAALGAGWGNETNQRLTREWMEFVDDSRESESCLMKSAADVRVFE